MEYEKDKNCKLKKSYDRNHFKADMDKEEIEKEIKNKNERIMYVKNIENIANLKTKKRQILMFRKNY